MDLADDLASIVIESCMDKAGCLVDQDVLKQSDGEVGRIGTPWQ